MGTMHLMETMLGDRLRRVCKVNITQRGRVLCCRRRREMYGVDGLRIVDASISPLLPREILQTLVYAIAETAAD
jgi:hypothetical protein